MKLAGTVILYNPPENLIENILTYIDDIEKLYIYDNSPEKGISFPNKILNKSEYVHSGNNEGIAKRLNEAIKKSNNEGFDYLLTMDQDSSFKKEDLEKYIMLIKDEKEITSISIYGVRYYELKKGEDNNKLYNQILITSGSILNISIAIKLCKFDENLFIDGVDTEYCLKSFQNGYKTIIYNNISLIHSLGETKLVLTPNLKKNERKFHNPIRLYYITRNHFYLRNKYPEFRSYLKNKILYNEIKNCLLYGGNTLKYLHSIIIAIKHYQLSIFGKQIIYHDH